MPWFFYIPNENKLKLNKLKADHTFQKEKYYKITDLAFCRSFSQTLRLQARANHRALDKVYIHSAQFLYYMLK